MDVRDSWLVTLTEQQKRQYSARNNSTFVRHIRARQQMQRVQSARLRLAVSAAVLTWLWAGIESVIKS